MRCDGEGQAHVHAARGTLHRRVDKPFDFGKGDNLVELAIDFSFVHAENRAVEIDVLAAGELGMKAGADFEQRADAPVNLRMAFRRFGYPRKNFQERALPCSVASDDPNNFAALYFKRNVV